MTTEQKEIIRNARAAYRQQKIDLWQLWDVYFMIARDMAEKAIDVAQNRTRGNPSNCFGNVEHSCQ